MDFQIVDRQMIINQLEAIKILESTIRNEVIETQVKVLPKHMVHSLSVVQVLEPLDRYASRRRINPSIYSEQAVF